MQPQTPPAPAERFARILDGLRRAVAARGGRGGLAGPLVILIWSRLSRLAGRFARLAERVAAGTAAPRRRASPRQPGKRPRPPYQRLPRSFAWLCRLVPGEAAAHGSQLQHLLSDPEMAALIAAAPQARRLLRPLCRMLGVRPPPALLRPPPAPPAMPSSPAASGPAPAPRPRRPAPGPAPMPPRHACGPPVAA